MNKKFILIMAFLMLISMPIFAFGGKEKDVPKVQVTGIVRLVGTSIFSEIVISGEEYEWYIEKEDANKLHDLQHQRVTVEGEETVKEMRFANGMPAGTRRELRNIKIITVE